MTIFLRSLLIAGIAVVASFALIKLGGEALAPNLVEFTVVLVACVLSATIVPRIGSSPKASIGETKAPENAKPTSAATKAPTSNSKEAQRYRGQVKWFNAKKGYGFLTTSDGEDVFVHLKSVNSEQRGRRVLGDGQAVEFDIERTEKGPEATNVNPL